MYKTIGQAFDEIVDRCPDRPALISMHQDVEFTWSQLSEKADQIAAGLLTLGLKKGDRVGVWSPNCWEWVATQFATAKAGLILVCINQAYQADELAFALGKVGCRALIMATKSKDNDYVETLKNALPSLATQEASHLDLSALPNLKHVIVLDSVSEVWATDFRALCTLGTTTNEIWIDDPANKLQPDDAINIQFTSGTTGSPKGATLSHHNILNNGYFTGLRLDLSERDAICVPVPLYHCFGMVLGSMACVSHGATMVLPSATFSATETLKAVEKYKCTALYGVPTMFTTLLEHKQFNSDHMISLRTGIMAGAPCPVDIMQRVIDEMNMEKVTIGYGMTETSPLSFQTEGEDSIERRVSTVGRVHPYTEVKLVDELGKVVQRGEKGELKTRGYCVMKGYWDDPIKTADSIDEDGWMATGDLAVIDDEGYCSIIGRVKDMVIRGGENLFPSEIENFLYQHPLVQEVHVFGVADEKYGEQLCAWIRPHVNGRLSVDEVRRFCEGRIAHFKIPHYMKFVDTFPMTVTGKVQKFVMREMMEAELEIS